MIKLVKKAKILYVEKILWHRMLAIIFETIMWAGLLYLNHAHLGGSWMVTFTICCFMVTYCVAMSQKSSVEMTTDEAIKFFAELAKEREQEDVPK